MYSEKMTQQTLDSFEKKEGWRPEPHTIAEVDEFIEYVNSTIRIESNSRNRYICLTKGMTQSRQNHIRRFIENEQMMSVADCGYFESRYVYIRDEMGRIARFKNRKSQDIFDEIVAEMEEKQVPIELLIHRARQTGLGTKILLKLIHRVLFTPYSNALACAISSTQAEVITSLFDFVFEKCPWWLVPIRAKKGRFDNESIFSIQKYASGNISQGWTPEFIYLRNSEEVSNPAKLIEEGIFPAIFSSKRTFLAVEGKCVDDCTWFTSIWSNAKEYWHQGKSRLRPVFIPWWVSTDLYPTEVWLKKFPIPKGWRASDAALLNRKQCEAFAHSNPSLLSYLEKDWKMTREQIWYWEHSYCVAERNGYLDTFLKNMAPDDGDTGGIEQEIDEIDLDNIFPPSRSSQKRFLEATAG